MTQLEKIRDHLESHGKISSWEAIQNYGITRLSAHILELKKGKMDIHLEWQHPETGNKYGLYIYTPKELSLF